MATLGSNTMARADGKFIIKSFDVYLDADTNPTFYCEGEKSITFSAEFAEFVEGVPSSLVRKDLTRFGMSLSFNVKDFSARALELARGGEFSDETTYLNVYYGTDYIVPTTHKYTFVGETADGKAFELIIYKGSISEMPDLSIGSGEYASLPVVIEAIKDSTIADESRNLAVIRFEV